MTFSCCINDFQNTPQSLNFYPAYAIHHLDSRLYGKSTVSVISHNRILLKAEQRKRNKKFILILLNINIAVQ